MPDLQLSCYFQFLKSLRATITAWLVCVLLSLSLSFSRALSSGIELPFRLDFSLSTPFQRAALMY